MPLYDLPHPGEALEPLPAPGAAGRSRSGGRPGRSPAAGPLGVALSSLEVRRAQGRVRYSVYNVYGGHKVTCDVPSIQHSMHLPPLGPFRDVLLSPWS